MASVTVRVASFENDLAFVDVTLDDATLKVSSIAITNNALTPLTAKATKSDGTTVDCSMAASTANTLSFNGAKQPIMTAFTATIKVT